MKKKGLWFGLVLLLLLLVPVSAAFADDPGFDLNGGQIFVDEDVSLEPGETFSGDLGVFNGDLTVPRSSVVEGNVFVVEGNAEIAGLINGSLAVMNGDLSLADDGEVQGDVFSMSGNQEIAGRVAGDLSVMFGNIELLSSAVVEGDVVVISGSLEREAGAQVLGQVLREFRLPEVPLFRELPSLPELPEMPRVTPPAPPEMPRVTPPALPEMPRVRPPVFPRETTGQEFGRFVGRVLAAGFFGLIFMALGVLIVFVWPRATRQVSECIRVMPLQSLALGLLTFLIAAVLEALAMVLMILIILVAAALISTIILIPIGLLLILLSVLVLLPVPLALAAAMVLGWVAVAELVGRKAIEVLKAGYVQSLGATLVGLLITVSFAALLWVIKPLCCGWPFIVFLTSLGLGAVFHTRFGRQSCHGTRPPAQPQLLPPEAMDAEVGQPDIPPVGTP